jgi:hypothetical protein
MSSASSRTAFGDVTNVSDSASISKRKSLESSFSNGETTLQKKRVKSIPGVKINKALQYLEGLNSSSFHLTHR